jgi:hypothetical protein
LPPHAPIEQRIELQEGEKNRIVRVRFGPKKNRHLAPTPAEVEAKRPISGVTYALAGAATLSGAASAVLLFSALSLRDQALEHCAPSCSSDLRESIERRLLFADVTGVAALTFASVAVYTYVRRPRVPPGPSIRPALGLGLGKQPFGFGVTGAF